MRELLEISFTKRYLYTWLILTNYLALQGSI